MDDTNDATVESQPTQLLQHVLGGFDESTSYVNSRNGLNRRTADESRVYKEYTPEPATSSTRLSVPKYHFHGLAATQTETQHEEYVEYEGPQKENAPAAYSDVRTRLSPPSSPSSPSRLTPKGQRTDNATSYPPSRPSATTSRRSPGAAAASLRGNPTKNPSFPITRSTATPSTPYPANSLPHQSSTRRRQPSHDSFTGDPISQDPEREFLATNKQFNVPLDQLGRDSYSQESPEATQTSVPLNENLGASSSFTHDMHTFPNSIRRSSPIHGKVLVEPTPSNSDGSQDHSRESRASDDIPSQNAEIFSHRQPMDVEYDDSILNQILGSQGSTQPTSSYERLIDGDLEPYRATQQSTQPSTQPVDELQDHNEAQMDQTGQQENVSSIGAPSVSTVPSTNPRSLLNMVNSHKRQKLLLMLENNPPPPTRTGLPSSSSVVQETPQSVRHHEDTADFRSTGTGWGLNKSMDNNSVQQTPGLPVVVDSDAMEVVPDSEPPRMQSPSSSKPKTRQIVATGSALKQSPRKGRGKATDLNDIVPDSLEIHGGGSGDDDEDDVPLALSVGSKPDATVVAKGKSIVTSRANLKSGVSKSIPDVPRQTTSRPTRLAADNTITATHKTRGTKNPPGPSWETTEVPSSAPEQDFATTAQNQVERSAQGKKVLASRRANGSTTAAKRRRISSETDDEMDILTRSPSTVTTTYKEEEEETELAEDDYVDMGSGRSSVKRKRSGGAATRSIRNISKVSTRSSKISDTTPMNRSIKRLRSAAPSSRGKQELGTRVFALWKKDGHYYSGTVYSHDAPGTRYRVLFDDGDSSDVDLAKLRACELHEGDNVLIQGRQKSRKAIVVVSTSSGADDTVEVITEDTEETVTIPLSNLMIANRSLLSQWKDRMLDAESISTTLKPKVMKATPTSSRLSVTSKEHGPSRSNSLFQTALMISLSPGLDNWQEEKDKIMTNIQKSGGTVIEDWLDVLPMAGKHSNAGHRWVAAQEDIKWTPNADIRKLFLVSDDHHQKPKYLIALALGVPCVSIEWLRQETIDEDDWSSYLLPAGFSDTLGARISQMIDLDWGNSIEYLKGIGSNPVASKLFSAKSILCLGPDFVPTNKTRKSASDSERAKEATRTVPRIILAMGADRVEAASERRYVSDQTFKSFDYIVFKSDYERDTRPFPLSATCVNTEWIKDCLISNRILSTQPI